MTTQTNPDGDTFRMTGLKWTTANTRRGRAIVDLGQGNKRVRLVPHRDKPSRQTRVADVLLPVVGCVDIVLAIVAVAYIAQLLHG